MSCKMHERNIWWSPNPPPQQLVEKHVEKRQENAHSPVNNK